MEWLTESFSWLDALWSSEPTEGPGFFETLMILITDEVVPGVIILLLDLFWALSSTLLTSVSFFTDAADLLLTVDSQILNGLAYFKVFESLGLIISAVVTRKALSLVPFL